MKVIETRSNLIASLIGNFLCQTERCFSVTEGDSGCWGRVTIFTISSELDEMCETALLKLLDLGEWD